MGDKVIHITKELLQEQFFPQIRKVFEELPDTFPDFLGKVSEEEQRENEEVLSKMLPLMEKFQQEEFSPFFIGTIKKQEIEQKFQDFICQEKLLNIRDLGDEAIENIKKAVFDFIEAVGNFNKEITKGDFWQAFRNYLICLMLLLRKQLKPECSPALVGYSLLYPYTDNIMDEHSFSEKERQSMNQLIYDEITGKNGKAASMEEKRIQQLLRMIKNTFPYEKHPFVYDGLYLIYDAQIESLKQKEKISYEEIRDISIYKGGTSVLADRLLFPGEFSLEELPFYLQFGFFLQLSDDLQDGKEDREKGSSTLFTLVFSEKDTGSKEAAAKRINKLFHFAKFLFPLENQISNFIFRNCILLILMAAVENKEQLTEEYWEMLESKLPVSWEFIKKKDGIFSSSSLPEVNKPSSVGQPLTGHTRAGRSQKEPDIVK